MRKIQSFIFFILIQCYSPEQEQLYEKYPKKESVNEENIEDVCNALLKFQLISKNIKNKIDKISKDDIRFLLLGLTHLMNIDFWTYLADNAPTSKEEIDFFIDLITDENASFLYLTEDGKKTSEDVEHLVNSMDQGLSFLFNVLLQNVSMVSNQEQNFTVEIQRAQDVSTGFNIFGSISIHPAKIETYSSLYNILKTKIQQDLKYSEDAAKS